MKTTSNVRMSDDTKAKRTSKWNEDTLLVTILNRNYVTHTMVTDNLNMITNTKLSSLLTKGPSYREAERVDWKRNFHMIS